MDLEQLPFAGLGYGLVVHLKAIIGQHFLLLLRYLLAYFVQRFPVLGHAAFVGVVAVLIAAFARGGFSYCIKRVKVGVKRNARWRNFFQRLGRNKVLNAILLVKI